MGVNRKLQEATKLQNSHVFPTPVGVNQEKPMLKVILFVGFPHTRGGEPKGFLDTGTAYTVFPTPVGVNRWSAAKN